VKENEKFKVAKEIIEKYGSEDEIKQLLGGNEAKTIFFLSSKTE